MGEQSPTTEPGVVSSSIDGRASFEAFFAAEMAAVLALVLVVTRSRSAAEEIAQEAFLRAWKRWAVVDALDHPGAWVRRVALNLATSRFRRLRVERLALPKLISPAIDVEHWTRDDELWTAVRRLPARQRQVIALTYVEGRPADEVGRILGIAGGTVRVHLARARATLRAELGDDR